MIIGVLDIYYICRFLSTFESHYSSWISVTVVLDRNAIIVFHIPVEFRTNCVSPLGDS
jgi:hypothetical protein